MAQQKNKVHHLEPFSREYPVNTQAVTWTATDRGKSQFHALQGPSQHQAIAKHLLLHNEIIAIYMLLAKMSFRRNASLLYADWNYHVDW